MSIAQQYPEGSQQYRQLRNQENYAVAQAAGLTQQAGGAQAAGAQAGGLQAGGLQAGGLQAGGLQAGGFGGQTAAANAYGLNPGVAGRAGRQFVGNTIADQLASQFLAQQGGAQAGGLTQQAGAQPGAFGGGLTD